MEFKPTVVSHYRPIKPPVLEDPESSELYLSQMLPDRLLASHQNKGALNGSARGPLGKGGDGEFTIFIQLGIRYLPVSSE